MDGSTVSVELIMILVLTLLILTPLALIAISKVCCSVLTIYSDYKFDKRRRYQTDSANSEVESELSSTTLKEKETLIDNFNRLEREAGVRLDNYPFAVDYERTIEMAALVPVATQIKRKVSTGSEHSQESGVSSNNSQALGSDSPSSDPFSDSHIVQISDDDETYMTSPSPHSSTNDTDLADRVTDVLTVTEVSEYRVDHDDADSEVTGEKSPSLGNEDSSTCNEDQEHHSSNSDNASYALN